MAYPLDFLLAGFASSTALAVAAMPAGFVAADKLAFSASMMSTTRVTELGMFQYWTRCAQNLPDDLRRMYMELDGLLK